MEDRERIVKQLRVWQEHLLDLSRGNPLLGINRSRTSKLQVSEPVARRLFDTLVVQGRKLRMPLHRRQPPPAQPALLPAGSERPSPWIVREGDVRFAGEPADIYRRLRRIRDNARTTVEERGVTTLHLTLGAVRWNDQYLGESVAPLLLIPCAFESKRADDSLLLVTTDEDLQLNPALELYLRERHKRALPSLPDELSTTTFDSYLAEIRRSLGKDWRVSEEAWLSTFSFETMVMHHDLGRLKEAAQANAVVAALAGATVARKGENSERLGDDLDALPTRSVLSVPALPADSSQLEALEYARADRHLIIHGPPGTGKSQTIANLIADRLAEGNTVLFVSAKMAALEVVFERLARLGLDRFCLEAHSTKAGKARIIDDLRRTLEAAEQIPAIHSPNPKKRYWELRDQLNIAVRELHRPRDPLGCSIYQVLGRFAKVAALPELRFPLPWPNPTQVTQDALDQMTDLVQELQAQAVVFAARETHPWRDCRARQASYTTREALIETLDVFHQVASRILKASPVLEPFLGPLHVRSLADLERSTIALYALAETIWLPAGWSEQSPAALDATAETLRTAAAKAASLVASRARFAELTDGADPLAAQPILAPALDQFENWFKRMLPAYYRWRREVQASVHPKAQDYRVLADLARLAGQIASDIQWLDEHQTLLDSVLPTEHRGRHDEQALLEAAGAVARAADLQRGRMQLGLREAVAGPCLVSAQTRTAATEVLRQLPSGQPDLRATLGRLDATWGGPFVENLAVGDVPLATAVARCEEALSAQGRLMEWLQFQDTLERCRKMGLSPFLEALNLSGADHAVGIFHRRFYLLWLDAHISQTQALKSFHGATREELIGEFASLDESMRAAAAAKARAAAAARASQINHTTTIVRASQLGILKRELAKKRPRPLRRLFADIPNVLQALKPCMLMSPVSVSTYLTPDTIDFHTVVFDEASQLPPQEAVPAILRAKQVVVAGDENQLPPTSFFSSSLFAEADEVEEQEDTRPLESLLHECKSLPGLFQEAQLRWHYRSRDERLIAFSNHYFYNGRLITFPSPGNSLDRGVQLHYVADGVWDRGRSRTNRPEARAVADIVIHQLDTHPERSLGVVALNITQKEAVEDALEETLLGRPDLRERLMADGKEAFFVKALENVQGDERDTIIISVGYGRDRSGTLYLNFGPLNLEGGWRRLNVLVTRAKYLTVLVTSLRSTDLGAIAPSNRGATALRQFIEYAERGCRIADEAPHLTGAETNDFEEAVAAALRARGLQVEEQVGASSFRIDLAVRDPRDPSWFVLGIECDGATYHSSRNARDRDVLRAEILRGMGWRLHRIWSVDWFRSPEEVTAAAVRAVERAMAHGDPSSGVPAPVDASVAPATRSPSSSSPSSGVRASKTMPTSLNLQYPPGVPYQTATVRHSSRTLLLDSAEISHLTDEIVRVVVAESPIHSEVLLDRLKQLHGNKRTSKKVRENFDAALKRAIRQRRIRRDSRGFLWTPGQDISVFRVPAADGTARKIEHIPFEEIRLAILHLVESQFGVLCDAIVPETRRLLGIKEHNAIVQSVIAEVVDQLIHHNELDLKGNQLTLP